MGLSYVIYGFTAGLHLSRTGSEMELEEERPLSECVVWVCPVCGLRVCCVWCVHPGVECVVFYVCM